MYFSSEFIVKMLDKHFPELFEGYISSNNSFFKHGMQLQHAADLSPYSFNVFVGF